MSVMTVVTKITRKYLMNKSKFELADWVLDALDKRDEAYKERDMLVAALTTVFPASLERHQPETDIWAEEWRWVVIVDTPSGQVSWHIHDSELPMFNHLERNAGRVWDGHTTKEKYERLAKLQVSHEQRFLYR